MRIKGQLTGFPDSPGLPENPISPGRPLMKKEQVCERVIHSVTDILKNYCVLICLSGHLQEVQCALGFLVAQKDPEAPAK